MKAIKVLAVDDNGSKLRQLVRALKQSSGIQREGLDGVPPAVFLAEKFQVMDGIGIEQVVEAILGADCAVIDYQLKSDAIVPFTGVDVLNEVLKRHKNFPAFLLTSYQDDVFCNEIVDVCHVFAFDSYLESPKYARELNRSILRQVCNHERERKDWEEKLLALKCKERRTADDDERILELDTWVEQCISNNAMSVSKRAKRDLSPTKIDELISKIDELISSQKRR